MIKAEAREKATRALSSELVAAFLIKSLASL